MDTNRHESELIDEVAPPRPVSFVFVRVHSWLSLASFPLGAGLAALFCFVASMPAVEPVADGVEFFEKRIRPVLAERCYKCHSAASEKIKGGLVLDTREGLLKGGDTRPAIVPGNAEKSLLIEALHYTNEDLKMPPKGKLSPSEIADFVSWVKSGAVWPKEAAQKTASAKGAFDLEKRRREHWAWKPVASAVKPPTVKDTHWPAGGIDRFILAKLEEKKLKPAPAAERVALLRRVYFDLIGLPPKPAEIEAFLNDTSPQAFAKIVDHLLGSPHFGERWARHWLDLVRYAETRGHESDYIIPNAWQYRDYVIRALNAGVPYDQFVTEQIAGDLMAKPRLSATGANESVLGTGFWFLGEEVHSPVDIRQDECDRMDNRVDVMTKTFLGLTVACARCHDHKFDAISQKDYYSLNGFLISSSYRQVRFETIEQHKRIANELDQLRSSAQASLTKALGTALHPGVEKLAAQLLAAREHLSSTNASSAANASSTVVSDTESVARWTKGLAKAKADPKHPLHAFAIVPTTAPSAETIQQTLAPLLEGWRKNSEKVAFVADDIVVDYTLGTTSQWYQDGFSFGLRPARAGELRIAGSAEKPLVNFITQTGAWWDEAWKKLKVAGSEKDGGKLGEWERGEQTLRTPEFTLKAGRLWYLVKGSGRAYSPVNSHLVVIGPLHGATLREWKSDDDQWHWVEHDLSAYPGHRAHVEFSPAGTNDFAVAMVVQTDPKQALVARGYSRSISKLGSECDSVEILARALQGVFMSVAAELKADRLVSSGDVLDGARLANWLVKNLDLFCAPGSQERAKFDAAVKSFAARQAELTSAIKPDSHTAPAILDGNGVDEFLLVRGQSKTPGAPVPRRFLEAIASVKQPDYGSGSGRLQLAQQLTDPANPFTSRVLVNRVWHHLFGRGIVPTVDNFGVLGQPPSHVELLDYLAGRFMREQGWSMKQLIRELVLTRTYQMSSQPADARAEELDPQNLLLHRANLRRLEGEVIRDALLTVSGRLDPKVCGPSVPVHLTSFMDGRGKPSASGPLDGDGRRSIYIAVRRNFLSPMMLAFDGPIPFNTIGRRNISNVPAQALILMNDPFVVEQSKLWAKRLAPGGEKAPKPVISEMYLTAFGRPPSLSETAQAIEFMQQQGAAYGVEPEKRLADERVWADLGHVLFNVKEFIFIN